MIEQNRKKIRFVFLGVFLVLCLLLGMSKSMLHLSDRSMWILYWVLCAIILISWYVINQLWYREFCRTVIALRPILTEQKDYDLYIEKNEELLEGKKSEQVKGMLRMNLCVAYCEKKDYREAKNQLLALRPRKLQRVQRVVYWIHMAYVCFYLEENEEALGIISREAQNFIRFAQNPHIGGLIAILNIFKLIATEHTEEAQEALEEGKQLWSSDHLEDDFSFLEAKLAASNL